MRKVTLSYNCRERLHRSSEDFGDHQTHYLLSRLCSLCIAGELRANLYNREILFELFEPSLAAIELVINAQLIALEALGKRPNVIINIIY